MKKLWLITICLVLTVTMVAQVETQSNNQNTVKRYGGIICGADPLLPTDGTPTDDFVSPSTSSYYLLNLKAGKSYSVDVWDSSDPTIAGTVTLTLLTASGCSPVSPAPTDVTKMDPELSGTFAQRVSWIQPADAQAVLQVQNNDASNFYAYTVRITDTSLINPRWSTFGTFITQWAFVNNTSVAIIGTLTVYDNSGNLVTSVPNLTVPASAENFQSISTPVNTFGFATFAFVGPPGAVTADAYFINRAGTVIVPSSFAPRNRQH